MRLKTFSAKTMKEAMQMVRDAIGEDAVIIATRDEPGGGVRVTAALDPDARPAFADEGVPTDKKEFEDWLYAGDDDSASVVEEITEAMLRHAVPEEVLDHIVSAASVMGLDDSRTALSAALQNIFTFKPLPQNGYSRALMAVGPPGAGKTLAIAKLAARATMNGLKAAVITTDTVRAGGVEQLEAFTRLMKIPLKKASDVSSLKAAMAEFSGVDQLLIDTPGANPFQPESLKELARMIASGPIEPIMVMPAGLDADESGEMARVFAALGARALLPSRIDVARRLGGLLAAAHQGNLALTDASDTARVADGLVTLTSKRLTQLLMPRAKAETMQERKKA